MAMDFPLRNTKSHTGLSLSVSRVFGFQNDVDIWLGEGEWALVQEQRSVLPSVDVPFYCEAVRRCFSIAIEMIRYLKRLK